MKKLFAIMLCLILLVGCDGPKRKGKGPDATDGVKTRTQEKKGEKTLVSEENAKNFVLTLVQGAKEKDIRKFEKEYDDGVWKYEIELVFKDMEYEFEINAETGEIIGWDSESLYD